MDSRFGATPAELRGRFERLTADEKSFWGLTWLWAPELYRRMRAMAHRLRANPSPEGSARLEGWIAYLAMLKPEQAEAKKSRL